MRGLSLPPAGLRCFVVMTFLTPLWFGGSAKADGEKAKNPPVESEYKPKDNPAPVELPPDPNEAQVVKLDRGLDWFKAVEDSAPLRGADKNEDEHNAYNYVLAQASKMDPKALARHSMKDVPFANLVEKIRQDYQFELIHFSGRAIRIDAMKPTEILAKTTGIKQLYEVWIFPNERANAENPVCLVVSELPAGIKAGRDQVVYVSFDAYYFKLLKYESGEKLANGRHQWRVAPLFLGKTFNVVEAPSDDDVWSFRGMFVPAVLTLLGAIGFAVLGISLYFRRGDRQVKARLAATQDIRNPNPFRDNATDWQQHPK